MWINLAKIARLCSVFIFLKILSLTEMATRIDKTISKFSGVKNYMEQLAMVTGNINSLDESWYTDKINCVRKTFELIIEEFKKMNIDEHVRLSKVFNEKPINGLNNLYIDVKKKDKTRHKPRIRPQEIYDSNWFECVKELEKNAAEMMEQVLIESAKVSEEQLKVIQTNHNVVDTFKFYGVGFEIDTVGHNEALTKLIYMTSKYANMIIDIILTPMYDVNKFMDKHWMSQIDTTLGLELQKKKQHPITTEDIKKYLYLFVITKYRLELTKSPDAFVNILTKSVDHEILGSANPARFLNLLDTLKLDDIKDKEGIRKMTEIAKNEIKKITENKDIKPSEILKDIEELLSYGEREETEEKDEQDKDDVFC